MRVVQKLPEHVINQIKAGEVVERPVSVVKELLENALDAGAQSVELELLDGGRQMIRIVDDGSGMSRDDAMLALERHATSKIVSMDDLLQLSTFGFRGEALPTIASVSDFTLRTRQAGDAAGTEIIVRNGRTEEPQICGMALGTEIIVKNLFESIPARRKFLRSTATEFGHVHELVHAMALAYYKINFRLIHNGRDVLKVSAAQTLRERFQTLLGSEASEFVPVSFEKGTFRLEGFVQKPEMARPVPRYFTTFVNGRLVKDRVVRNGVLSGYTGLVMKGLVPACVLFVVVDPQTLDVNAHPNKTEIRFTDASLVQDLVTLGLQSDLRKSTQNQMLSTLPVADTIIRVPPEERRGEWSASVLRQNADHAPSGALSALLKQSSSAPRASFVPSSASSSTHGLSSSPAIKAAAPVSSGKGAQTSDTLFESAAQMGAAKEPTKERSEEFSSQSPLGHAQYLGQFKNCYLLFESQEDLLVVDQHAFHERVLFEELSEQIEGEHGLGRQLLLAPLTVPIPSAIAAVLSEEEQSLLRLGFEIEVLPSARSVALHALPTQVELGRATELFDDIIARLLAVRQFEAADAHPLLQRSQRLSQEWLEAGVRPAQLSRREIFHLHLATVACHSAVRSGDPMSPELVRRLLLRGAHVDFFAHCPHGRPVWRRWTAKDVAQWFSRI
jgi:DNA mismatch repair protein MutL